MPIVVVGGHSRNVGKTSVVAGLIAELREFGWLAVKITQFGHGVCAVNGEACGCALQDHRWAIEEETDRASGSDTSRFLAAGARRALWARTKAGDLAEAMPALRQALGSEPFVIIESNSIIRFLRPDLYLALLDPANPDFKASAREFLDRADALLMIERRQTAVPRWKQVSLKPVASRPRFSVAPPSYLNDQVVGFVRERLAR